MTATSPSADGAASAAIQRLIVSIDKHAPAPEHIITTQARDLRTVRPILAAALAQTPAAPRPEPAEDATGAELRALSEAATQGHFYYSKSGYALRCDQGKGAGPTIFIADDGSPLSTELDERNGAFIARLVNAFRSGQLVAAQPPAAPDAGTAPSLANGRPVQKVTGDYSFEGLALPFRKRSGALRLIVEDDRGLVHIFSPSQVGLTDVDFAASRPERSEDGGAVPPGPVAWRFRMHDDEKWILSFYAPESAWNIIEDLYPASGAAPAVSPSSPESVALREALENLVIAVGMGWDLDGALDVARAALAATGKEGAADV